MVVHVNGICSTSPPIAAMPHTAAAGESAPPEPEKAPLIRLKRIYNFCCSMFVYTPFALCFVTLCDVFMYFPELTY
jgi:hypothetical protein